MIRGKKLPRKAAERINIAVDMGIHNRFDVEVIDAVTGELKQTAVGYNVICNALWTRLLTPTTYFNYIHYGTGTGSPAASDTSLFQFLGYDSAGNESSSLDETNGVYTLRRSIQLAPETAVGATLTEVGIAHGYSSNTLCTHAMLQDMNGNPISINKSDTDVINIYASVYLHYNPKGYMNSSVFLGGHTVNSAFMKSLCGGYDLSYGWPNFAFASSAWGMYNEEVRPYSDSMGATKTFDAANKRMTVQMDRMGVSDDNLPIREIIFASYRTSSSSNYPGMSGPAIQLISGRTGGWFPPCRITGEALGTGDGSARVFSTAFPFASSPVVYVDGAAVESGVTVSSGLNTCSAPNRYMSSIACHSTPNNIIPASYDIGGYRYAEDREESSHYVGTGKWYYFYNPAYETVPITHLYGPYCTVEASTDMEHWTQAYVFTDTSTKACPAALQNYPFWRMKRSQSYSPSWGNGNHYGEFTMNATGGNVTFDTPPAIGSVITIDYTTSVIPKDENHVLDITVTLQFGEYTEE